MYTEIGSIESSCELRLDAAFFGGSEAGGADHSPTLPDLDAIDAFFEIRLRPPASNAAPGKGGFEALQRAAAQSRK